jgi:hypothetical protein
MGSDIDQAEKKAPDARMYQGLSCIHILEGCFIPGSTITIRLHLI